MLGIRESVSRGNSFTSARKFVRGIQELVVGAWESIVETLQVAAPTRESILRGLDLIREAVFSAYVRFVRKARHGAAPRIRPVTRWLALQQESWWHLSRYDAAIVPGATLPAIRRAIPDR